ncbi:YrIlm family inverse autotransporter adhesin [Candidatus Symbiopectobacterium sp. NZEC127]|uniref:YrIlm family inverse autotransporter adhesin n=1 Tax=Candidatus Symbiopectobacterium sp. NZEC127 TaxID=2820472 RepID=UPI0039B65CFA
MVWVNIFFQLLFPLSISFSPAMAAAIATPAHTFSDTEPYVLGPGETVDAIAKRYGVSVEELQKINQYRTFSKPFSSLITGDEVEVPRKRSPFSVDNQPPAETENRLASQAAAGATMLSSKNSAKSAEQMARSAANSEINNSAQQWLSQYGTARVQLNVNDDFKLDGSAVDVLVPLKDNNKNMLFTQLGARNKDSRNTLNAGIGYRTFQDNWMYGVNTFFDNDITGKNRRVGVGAEAWADYLKLSVNSYYGLTDWHQSRDFIDYYERPANGYDVRAEAYLPAYPQLGGKLMYEHYRGNDVALFGKNNRQKDPYALTTGLNYTPIPLFTVGAEHRAGKGGQSDSSLNLQFNYRLGSSWQSHIDPSAVASSRTLAGSRYDLVERNNNIVLEYQKQDVIRLTLPAQINGEAGTAVTVNAQVDSQHSLDRIEWDSSALVAAGGEFSQVSPQSVVMTLPPYQSARNSNSNVYTVTAVAYDSRGNASPRSTLQISVEPSTADITEANLTTTTNNALANGTESNAVQAVVTDASGNAVAGQSVDFTASNGAQVTTVIGTTGADGIAKATLTNTKAGTSVVTATVNGKRQTVNVTFVADEGTAEITEANLTATTNNALANGTESNAVQALVTDARGNAVAGQSVNFTASNGAQVTTVIGTTGADGIAKATLTNTTAGTSVVTATVNGKDQTVETCFVADEGTAEITEANLMATTNGAVANGTESNAVQALVTDARGNAVAGQSVDFTASNGAQVTTVIGTTGADGIAKATLTNTKAGTSVVTATVNGKDQTVETRFLADEGTAEITEANLTATTNDAVADGTESNAVQALVTDARGNAVASQTVDFTASNGAQVTTVIGTTGADGIAKATLTNTRAGTSVVTATVNGKDQTVNVTFVADEGTAEITEANLTATTNDAVADGTGSNAVQALVTDARGNVVAGQTVDFTASNGAQVTTVIGTTGADGIAKATQSPR